MKYRINKSNYRNFNIYEDNRLAARSYFIPYPDRAAADSAGIKEKRYRSPKVVCLNGDWDFRFYPRPSELPDVLDTDNTKWDVIDVPSCWQFRGYDKPFYVNARYQFPYNPPIIPEEGRAGRTFSWVGADIGLKPAWLSPGEEYNYVGVYRRFFDAKDNSLRYILSFLGVASCADVYVNGLYVGYTEGSHNTAEFDISPFCNGCSNELVVVVHRWCNGTYLECQDMFRNNGIFRDVLLRITDDKYDIWDMDFRTVRESGKYSASIGVSLHADADTDVKITLEGYGLSASRTIPASELALCSGAEDRTRRCNAKSAGVILPDLDVKEWNAEYPALYNLYIETAGSCVKTRVGFKEITIDGDVYLMNRSRIKLHGVNHHDTSCTNGYYMTPDEIERDMLICKEYNIDTVRTSHYPPDPLLPELCDELGIYVVDEADLETHGTFAMTVPASYNRISHDPKWEKHYLDRIERLYQRDRNHVSIVMWSLGNESGGYHNTDMMYDYLKERTDVPVHYESAVHCKRKAYDVGSEMYPTPENVHRVGNKTRSIPELCDRPYFLCEYAHAMGVGPGDMEAYWKEIYSFDSLMGGCVWEMADHAVLHEDGSYTYGGDQGEWMHDGNFCVDGIFYPDRSPSTGALITKFVYRPVRVSHIAEDTFEVFNTTAFSPGERFLLKCRWSDGYEENAAVEAGPLCRALMTLNTAPHIIAAEDAGTDCLLDITTIDNYTGREASAEQIVIRERIAQTFDEAAGYRNALCSYGTYGTLTDEADSDETSGRSKAEADVKTIRLSDIMTVIDGRPVIRIPSGGGERACISDPVVKGPESDDFNDTDSKTMTASDPYTILFRAPADNDYVFFGIRNSMADHICQKEELISVTEDDDSMEVVTRIKCRKQIFTCTDTYELINGGIAVTSRVHCNLGIGEIPRFGKAFRLDSSYNSVEYYGRSGESYADMKDHAPIRHVVCNIGDMTEPNIRPQESGNRTDCRWAAVSDGNTRIVFAACRNSFELGIKPYTDRELINMRHREDENVSGTYVTISAFQKGIGTGICGPKTAPEYCFPARQDYELRFLITFEQL